VRCLRDGDLAVGRTPGQRCSHAEPRGCLSAGVDSSFPVHQDSCLQRYIPVLLGAILSLLGFQHLHARDQLFARVTGWMTAVHEAGSAATSGLAKPVAEFFDFFFAYLSRSVRPIEITAVNDGPPAFRAHYGDFSCRPTRSSRRVRMCLEPSRIRSAVSLRANLRSAWGPWPQRRRKVTSPRGG